MESLPDNQFDQKEIELRVAAKALESSYEGVQAKKDGSDSLDL